MKRRAHGFCGLQCVDRDVSPVTLWRWRKAGVGPPCAEPGTEYRGNVRYYRTGDLVAWRNRVKELDAPRSFHDVCEAWVRTPEARELMRFFWPRPRRWRRTRWHRWRERKDHKERRLGSGPPMVCEM